MPPAFLMRPLGISLGDPTGIGPEVVVRALASRPQLAVRIFGDVGVLERAARSVGVVPLRAGPVLQIIGVTALDLKAILPGQPVAASGAAQVQYLEAATRAAVAAEIAGLVTAPISKEWAGRAGFAFPGHTEFLADATGTTDFAMMLAGPKLRVTLATTHLALRDVFAALSVERIARTIILTATSLRDAFGLPTPRVAVAGLNPHAGEAGRFGDEEARLILPAVELARRTLATQGVAARLSGPHVPDVVFRQAFGGEFDAVVAMHHDQGLIPVKLMHFDEAVNLTLGLPFPRTSPDHGTAYDIAGTGKARAESFGAALDLAAALAGRAAGS